MDEIRFFLFTDSYEKTEPFCAVIRLRIVLVGSEATECCFGDY